MESINVVVIQGNLTRDPELRHLPSGNSVTKLRVAVNERTKKDGEWVDRANFFDVTVWGGQGESCAKYLEKGSGVMVSGRLSWREWEADGVKRQAVDITADKVRFMGGGGKNGGGSREGGSPTTPAGPTSRPIDDEDDIPFAFYDLFDPLMV